MQLLDPVTVARADFAELREVDAGNRRRMLYALDTARALDARKQLEPRAAVEWIDAWRLAMECEVADAGGLD